MDSAGDITAICPARERELFFNAIANGGTAMKENLDNA